MRNLLLWVVAFVMVVATLAGGMAAPPDKAVVDVWWDENTTSHFEFNYNKVDKLVSYDPPFQILRAKITIPYDTTGNVITPPDIFIRESAIAAFNRTISYCDSTDTFCYNKPRISREDQSLTFWVEHFTDYTVGAGQDYDNITACLDANNNTNNTCVINTVGVHVIQGVDAYTLNHSAIEFGIENATLNCNNTIIRGRQTPGHYGISADRIGNNITIQNCHTQNFFNAGVQMDANAFVDNNLLNHTDTNSTTGILVIWGDIIVENATLIDNHQIGLSATGIEGYVNNVSITEFIGGAGTPSPLYINLNAFEADFTNIEINSTASIDYCLRVLSNTGDNFSIKNATLYCPNTRYGIFFSNVNNGVIENVTVTSGLGNALLIESTSTNLTFRNNTLNHTSDGVMEHHFFASFSPFNNSGNLYDDLVRIYNADLSAFVDVTPTETEVDESGVVTGTQDFHVWLCRTPTSTAHYTLIVDSDVAVMCGAGCAAGGLVCDASENDAYLSNGNANYTWNGTFAVVNGNTDPPYIRYEEHDHQFNASIRITGGGDLNFSGNIITQTPLTYNFSSVYIQEGVGDTLFWLNHFRTSGIDDDSGNMSECNGNTGNFLVETVQVLNDDCGQSNFTNPTDGEEHAHESNSFELAWAAQDSLFPVNYSIYWGLDNSTWEFITETPNLVHTWDYSAVNTTNFSQHIYLRVVPNDGTTNATNGYRFFHLFKLPIDTGFNGSSVAITIFSLLSSFGIISLASVGRFTKNIIADLIIRRGLVTVGVLLLALTSAVVATVVGQSTIPLTTEMFTYMWLFGWTGYCLAAWLVIKTAFDAMSAWKLQKYNERMGNGD